MHKISQFYEEGPKLGEDDPDVVEERERRKKVRGKKRGAEDFSFVNEEFINSFQNRTNNFGDQPLESMFDGKDLTVDFEVSFTEAT